MYIFWFVMAECQFCILGIKKKQFMHFSITVCHVAGLLDIYQFFSVYFSKCAHLPNVMRHWVTVDTQHTPAPVTWGTLLSCTGSDRKNRSCWTMCFGTIWNSNIFCDNKHYIFVSANEALHMWTDLVQPLMVFFHLALQKCLIQISSILTMECNGCAFYCLVFGQRQRGTKKFFKVMVLYHLKKSMGFVAVRYFWVGKALKGLQII